MIVEKQRYTFIVFRGNILRVHRKGRDYSRANYFQRYYVSNPGKYFLETYLRIGLPGASNAATVHSEAIRNVRRRDFSWDDLVQCHFSCEQ